MLYECRFVQIPTITKIIKPQIFGKPLEVLSEVHSSVTIIPDYYGEKINTIDPVVLILVDTTGDL